MIFDWTATQSRQLEGEYERKGNIVETNQNTVDSVAYGSAVCGGGAGESGRKPGRGDYARGSAGTDHYDYAVY